MFNLIKAEFYKLVRSRAFYVILSAAAVMAVLFMFMMSVTLKLQSGEIDVSELPSGVTFTQSEGDGQDNVVDTDEKMQLGEFIQENLASTFVAMLVMILVSLFVNADQKNGFNKNIIGQLSNRGLFAVSKYVAIMASALAVMLVYTVFSTASAWMFFRENIVFTFSFEDAVETAGIFLIQYLLVVAVATAAMLFCILFRNPAPGIVIWVLFLGSGVVSFLYQGINELAKRIGFEDFDISLYAIETNIQAVGAGALEEDIMRAVIIGCVFLVVSLSCSMVALVKRDVK